MTKSKTTLPDDQPYSCTIIQGSFRNGFRFIGPFPTYGDADRFARENLDPDVMITWIESPDEYVSAGTLALRDHTTRKNAKR